MLVFMYATGISFFMSSVERKEAKWEKNKGNGAYCTHDDHHGVHHAGIQ